MANSKIIGLLADLPECCGVYFLKDRSGTILYIGKAKNLKNRVRSYFIDSGQDMRFIAQNTKQLVADIEVIITKTEKEALLLENNLIKSHSPRFNIKLKDDKTYPSIRLDRKAQWPKLEIVRSPKKDGAIYFGPYPSASAARQTLKIAQKGFRLRSCRDTAMRNRTRPCIQHQMHRCPAPCVLYVDPNEYADQVEFVRLFLLGKKDDLIKELKARMLKASSETEYERAAFFRDQISAVESTLSKQSITMPDNIDRDLIGFYRMGDEIQFALLEIREGRLINRLGYYFDSQEFPDSEVISSFLVQHYLTDENRFIPEEVVVSISVPEASALQELLSEKRAGKVQVIHSKRGVRAVQIETADLNAKQLFTSRLHDENLVQKRLKSIQTKLRLDKLPRRIECVDISHLGGTGTVGAVSVTIDGEISPKEARLYHVKKTQGGNDFEAIKEVLLRRFIRATNREKGWDAPDLLLVDGGKGQLAIALAVLRELGISDQPVVSIAKAREGDGDVAWDRIFLPNQKNSIQIRANASGLHILATARDEAHRLAISFQRRIRKSESFKSTLDKIPGVGPKTKRLLLKHMGSIKRIREATQEDLAKIPGISSNIASRIKENLK